MTFGGYDHKLVDSFSKIHDKENGLKWVEIRGRRNKWSMNVISINVETKNGISS